MKPSAGTGRRCGSLLTVGTASPGIPLARTDSVFPKDIVPLSDLRTAIRSRLRLELAYIDGERRSTKRNVWPLQVGFMDSARVLVAWCELREDFRFFRTDRIQTAVAKERYSVRRVDLLRDLKVHLQKLDRHP